MMTMICRHGTNNNDFLRTECRSRAMVDKTTDNGNDPMVAEFGFLFLARTIFRVISTEMDVQNCQYYCKRQIHKKFSMVYTLINYSNGVKMFKTLQ